jgi:hypothetical protein
VRRLNDDLAQRQVDLEAANTELGYQAEVLKSVNDSIMLGSSDIHPDLYLRD